MTTIVPMLLAALGFALEGDQTDSERCRCLNVITVRNQATVGVHTRGGEHGVLGSTHKEIEEER
jgi:hypothetical protein